MLENDYITFKIESCCLLKFFWLSKNIIIVWEEHSSQIWFHPCSNLSNSIRSIKKIPKD